MTLELILTRSSILVVRPAIVVVTASSIIVTTVVTSISEKAKLCRFCNLYMYCIWSPIFAPVSNQDIDL